jgi:hypothetical protein
MNAGQAIANARNAISRWSAANPNGSLAVWGVALMVLPQLFIACMSVIVVLAQRTWQPVGDMILVVFNIASTLFVFVIPLCFITGAIIVPIAGLLAFRDYRKRRATDRTNPPNPTSDAAPDPR